MLTQGMVLAWAAVWLYGVGTHRLPWWTLGAAATVNLVAFIAYWRDKHAARTGQWRTREDHLHLLGLLGGWPGARLAQWIFRHKSSKPAFQATYWATVAAHGAALAAWVFWPWLR